ncbi:MAG TPA: hypothetical protein PLW65_22185 [Pseudomonadota bacterium]|nr:hypothetical protein [Pseudomonadota bacterium]
MITSLVDLGGAVVLFLLGLYYLQRGQAWAEQCRGKGWRSGLLAARLTAVLGGSLFAMGLLLLLYSVGFAWLSERLPSR